MKHLKKLQELNEASENLNISDVSFSKSEIIDTLDKSDEVKKKLDVFLDSLIKPFEAKLEKAKEDKELKSIYSECRDTLINIDERLIDTSDFFMFTNYYSQLLENF